ncbi:MAG: transporter substrate-binding protein [Rariglobus sp.]|jgi:iron complex transport system substrate-binding protein|nr:transporter substrate-binding protein [Rariglobus sp.]
MPSLRILCAFLIGHWSLAIGHSAPAAPEPERIVSLGGAITETVFALGAGDQVVARDTSSVFPPAVHRLPDVGYFRTIGAEGVLAQNPTLILAAQGTGPAPQVELLKHSGVAFVHLDARPSADTLLANVTRLGEVLHRETEAAALVQKLRGQLDAVRRRTASAGPPRVVFLMSMNETATQAAYDGTAATALIVLAGGHNPLTGLTGYKPLNAEALLALDPDVILYGVNPMMPQAVKPPGWLQGTRAGRTGRIHALDLGYHLAFGPRLGDAVTEVASLLHPAATPPLASTNQ